MKLRCVLVDDNPAFLAAAKALLERQGFDVVAVASNGSQALRLVDDLRPDVVLLDIGLSGESGFDVARQIHGDGDADRPPVILVSTLQEEDYGDLISTSDAVGFLPKISLSADAIIRLLQGRGLLRPVSSPDT